MNNDARIRPIERWPLRQGWNLLWLASLIPLSVFGQTQYFSDVNPTDPWYHATATLAQLGIAHGCQLGTPPKFCVTDLISREDMAALIVQAWSVGLWNDSGAFLHNSFAPSTTPYFSDVPQGAPQFVFIQKLYELGVTAGFTAPSYNSSTGVITPGIFCPNNTACPGSGNVANYQAAVFIARARALIDNNCPAPYNSNPSSVPYTVTSTNSACSPNNFGSLSSTVYFGDTTGNYYSYIQRMADLNAYNNVYVPQLCAQYGSGCSFNLNGLISRANMAIELVAGDGLDPRALLSMNGVPPTTGTPIASVMPTVTLPFNYVIQPIGGSQAGSSGNSVGWTQFGLLDSAGNPYWCLGEWEHYQSQYDLLNLSDGNTGQTQGPSLPQVDSFCTVSLDRPITTSGNPPTVNAILDFTFSGGHPGTYSVMNQVTDANTGIYGPWQSVGTLTIVPIVPPAISVSPSALPPLAMSPGTMTTISLTVTTNSSLWGSPIVTATGYPSGLTFSSASPVVPQSGSATLVLTVQSAAGMSGEFDGTLTVAIGSNNSQAIALSVDVIGPNSALNAKVSGSGGSSVPDYVFTNGVPVTYSKVLVWGAYYFDSRYLTSCSASGSGLSIAVKTYPGTAYDDLTYTAQGSPLPGIRTVTCLWDGYPIPSDPIEIYDATPQITSVTPIPQSLTPQSTVITGVGFGVGTPTLTIWPPLPHTITSHSTTSITAQIAAPVAGQYLITVNSTGNNTALGFQSGGSPASSSQSSTGILAVYAVKPVIQGLQTVTTTPANPGPNAPVDAESQGFLELYGVDFTADEIADSTVTITGPGNTNWICGSGQRGASPCWVVYDSDTQINVQYDFSGSPVYIGNYQIAVSTNCGFAYCGSGNAWPFTVVPAIVFGGADVTGINSSVVVGEQIALTAVAPLPPGVTIQSQGWTVPGTTVGGFPGPTPASSGGPLPTNFTQASTTYYWADSQIVPRTVNYSVTTSSGQLNSGALFGVVGPTSATMTATLGVVTPWGTVNGVAYNSLNLGCAPIANSNPPQSICPPGFASGIVFNVSENDPPNVSGSVSFLQYIKKIQIVVSETSGRTQTCATPGPWTLDTSYPYATGRQTNDNPGDPNLYSATSDEESEIFVAQMFAMWTPNLAGAVTVPLGSINWDFAADAIYSSDLGTWILNPDSMILNSVGSANAGASSPFELSTAYPQPWTTNVKDTGATVCTQ